MIDNSSHLLLVGTHRRAHRADPTDIAHGIYLFECSASGEIGEQAGMIETAQPGWLAVHPLAGTVYAVNEVRELDGADGGAVSAFALDTERGGMRLLSRHRLPSMPCHCAVDHTGSFLLVATFAGGTLHLLKLSPDGSIAEECDRHDLIGSSAHPVRQTSPHPHAVAMVPGYDLVLVPDLGADRVRVFELDRTAGRLVPRPDRSLALPPLSGPRHIAFREDGRVGWLVNEMDASVTVLAIDPEEGWVKAIQTVDMLPEGFAGLKSGAAVVLSRDQRTLYATTRSHGSSGMPDKLGRDLVAWFAVEPASGTLALAGTCDSGGGIPRDAHLSPDGSALLVAHQCGGRISRFELSPRDGSPRLTAGGVDTPVPVALAFARPDKID